MAQFFAADAADGLNMTDAASANAAGVAEASAEVVDMSNSFLDELSQVILGTSLATASGGGAGLVLGATSAVAGVAAAKWWCDSVDTVYATRIGDIKRHAATQVAPGLDLRAAVEQLLGSIDWCLSLEERKVTRSVGFGLNALGLQRFNLVGVAGESGDSLRNDGRNLQRHLRRIWRLCGHTPSAQLPPSRGYAASKLAQFPKWLRQSQHPEPPPEQVSESYAKLFNPHHGGASGSRGACAALCFLVAEFLELRHKAAGSFHNSERMSLRLAVAALARHPLLKNKKDDRVGINMTGEFRDGTNGEREEEPEFRRGVCAILCLLDTALAWRPVDPVGVTGFFDDGAGVLICHRIGLCTFAALATQLRRTLKKAAKGCFTTWRRLKVHFAALRGRELPDPWPWVWVQREDASMLVRNQTKVRLKVELYRPEGSISPWADWPLLRTLFGQLAGPSRPVLVADVGPGVEWALRPKTKDGRQFQMRLVTKAGIVVCSKRLRRGQAFDFEIQVPARPRPQIAGVQRDVRPKFNGGGDIEELSTAVPSTRSARTSLASSATGYAPLVSGLAVVDTSPVVPLAPYAPKLALVEELKTAICPQCLCQTDVRDVRPEANVYAEGVRCDRCSIEVVGSEAESGEPFFHCETCMYDLCHDCALSEMREVWWDDD